MLVILGFVIVMGAVFGGFALDDGHLAALFQPYELLMIGGGALGAFVIANDRKSIAATLRALPTLFHTSKYTRALYLELMSLLYDILTKVRKEGLMSPDRLREHGPVPDREPDGQRDRHPPPGRRTADPRHHQTG